MNFLSIKNNDLLELNALANELKSKIEVYSHVKNSVPKPFLNQLSKFSLEVEKEIDLRNN